MNSGANRKELREKNTFLKTKYERDIEFSIKIEKKRKRVLNKKNRKDAKKNK